MAAFLTIYTPTYRRPLLLAECRASVAAQSDPDYQHLIIEDTVGVGVEGMFLAVRDNVGLIDGDTFTCCRMMTCWLTAISCAN